MIRLREASSREGPELVAAAGLAMTAVGVAVIADALVAAAQAHPRASGMWWLDRLLLGLWTFRVEHTLWFTLGAVAVAWSIDRGARVGGWAGPAARLTGGFAVGLLLVAAALAVASTWVAIVGHVGSGTSRIDFSTRERFFTWLLQVTTAAGGALLWGILAGRLSVLADRVLSGVPAAADVPAAPPPRAAVEPPPAELAPEPTADEPPPTLDAVAVRTAPVRVPDPEPPAPPAREVPETLAGQAEALYRDELAWSPRRREARRLVDEISSLERAGRHDEARERARALAALGGRPGGSTG